MNLRIPVVVAVAAAGLVALFAAGRAATAERMAGGTFVDVPDAIIGTRMPDMQFTAPDGQARTVSSYFDDATIVALLHEPCSPHSSALVKASQAPIGGVRLIEITTSGESCAAHDQCVLVRGQPGESLVSVCDPEGVIRGQLGVAPAVDVALLVDSHGTIVAAGSIKDFPTLLEKAKAMALLASRHRAVRA